MPEYVLAFVIRHNALWSSFTFARMHYGKYQIPKRILALISFATMRSEPFLVSKHIVTFNTLSTMRCSTHKLPNTYRV